MSKTRNGGYYRKYTDDVNNLDIRLLEALFFKWNGLKEGDPQIHFRSVIATKTIGDSVGYSIAKGDRIFITNSPLPENVEYILSEEALENILNLLFSLSPKLYKEALEWVSDNLGDNLSDWELEMLEERRDGVDTTLKHIYDLFEQTENEDF